MSVLVWGEDRRRHAMYAPGKRAVLRVGSGGDGLLDNIDGGVALSEPDETRPCSCTAMYPVPFVYALKGPYPDPWLWNVWWVYDAVRSCMT